MNIVMVIIVISTNATIATIATIAIIFNVTIKVLTYLLSLGRKSFSRGLASSRTPTTPARTSFVVNVRRLQLRILRLALSFEVNPFSTECAHFLRPGAELILSGATATSSSGVFRRKVAPL
jgi:hypothetical protein